MHTTSVTFFSEDIVLHVDTATSREHINREITLRDFAGGDRMSLHRIEDQHGNRYIARNMRGQFIEGVMV